MRVQTLNLLQCFLTVRSFLDNHFRKSLAQHLLERLTKRSIVLNKQCLEHLVLPRSERDFGRYGPLQSGLFMDNTGWMMIDR